MAVTFFGIDVQGEAKQDATDLGIGIPPPTEFVSDITYERVPDNIFSVDQSVVTDPDPAVLYQNIIDELTTYFNTELTHFDAVLFDITSHAVLTQIETSTGDKYDTSAQVYNCAYSLFINVVPV